MEFILVDRWGLVDVDGVYSSRQLGFGGRGWSSF